MIEKATVFFFVSHTKLNLMRESPLESLTYYAQQALRIFLSPDGFYLCTEIDSM